jgi:hypothetical protein
VTPSNREIAEHLLACYDTIYIVLGESAPKLSNDAYVVCAYEAARVYGALALELREHLGEPVVEPIRLLDEVLRRAVADDETGALVLYAMAMVVGPRLLVSLLDGRNALDNDPILTALFNDASMACVRAMRAFGEVAKDQAPIDDLEWQSLARDLATTLDLAGNAESLGISR